MITKYKIFEKNLSWSEYNLDILTHEFCKTIIPDYESYEDISSDDEEQIGKFLTNKFYGEKVNFINEYGKLITGSLIEISFSLSSDGDPDFDNFYIRIHDLVLYCMSYDNHILKVYEEEIEKPETRVRWYKGGKLQEGLNYDFKIGDKVIINSNLKNYHWKHLEKYIGDQYTITSFENTRLYGEVAHLSNMVSFFPFDCLTLVNFEDGIGKVRWYKKGKLHEKVEEYPFIEKGDPNIDPGEEDWDD